MKNRLRMAIVVVLMGVLPVAFGEKGVYRLGNRIKYQSHRENVEVDPFSFSGDLDPIIGAAQDLADAEEAENGGNVTPGDGASIGCKADDSQVAYFQFTYEMETLPPPAALDDRDIILQDEDDVLGRLEKALNDALAEKLLYCPNSGYDASDEDTGIVEFNSLPEDKADDTANCDPTEIIDSQNTCQVMVGEMQVWFTPDSDRDIIEYMVMTATRDFLNNGPDVRGVARTRYLGPAIDNPSGISDGDTPSDGEIATASDSGLSNRSIIFMSVASVGFVAAVGLVTYFRLRKSHRQQDEVPYVATLENESSGEESPSRLDSSGEEDSNFSSIMPSNYRLDISESPFNTASSIASPSVAGMSSMGTIHESEDGRSDGSADILMSEGYTTEGSSIEFPYFENNYANPSPVLGARPRTVSFQAGQSYSR